LLGLCVVDFMVVEDFGDGVFVVVYEVEVCEVDCCLWD